MHTKVHISQHSIKDIAPQTKGVLRKLNNHRDYWEGVTEHEFDSFMEDILEPGFMCPEWLNTMQAFIARRHKKIVGWCTAHHEQWSVPRASTYKCARNYTINVYVHPAFRGQGIGTQLVMAAKAALRPRKRRFLANPIDLKGEKLFEKCGIRT